jgi:hypothetical protein
LICWGIVGSARTDKLIDASINGQENADWARNAPPRLKGRLLANKEAQKHKTSKKELDNMRALIARDLADAGIAGLSADRRFATAYNAALQAANMAIACAGYRIMSKVGHHRVSLESTKLVLGNPAQKYLLTFFANNQSLAASGL